MTTSALVFFLFGAVVLWGGLGVTLRIALKGEKKQ